VIGFNEYVGCYEGKSSSADSMQWQFGYAKPLIVSEFGAGARAVLHGAASERWTEEHQAEVYRHQLPMLNRIPQRRGMRAWLLMDFRSPLRTHPGVLDEFNRKPSSPRRERGRVRSICSGKPFEAKAASPGR